MKRHRAKLHSPGAKPDDGSLSDAERAQYRAVFDNTYLEPLVSLFSVTSPDRAPIVPMSAVGIPFNVIHAVLYFATAPTIPVPVEIRQSSQELDTTDPTYPDSHIIDLVGRSDPDPSVRILQNMGWGDTVKTILPFDFSRKSNIRKKTGLYLWKTFTALAAFIARCHASHTPGETMHILIRCKNGVERSLFLFNVVGFALALLWNAGHAHDYESSLSGLVSQTGLTFKPRLERFGDATDPTPVHRAGGDFVIAAIKRIEVFFEKTLGQPVRIDDNDDDDTTVTDASPMKRRK